MTETQFKQKVIEYVRRTYPDAVCWKLADKFSAGRPDMMIIKKGGKPIFIELKVGSNKPSKIQEYTLKALREVGCIAEVCWTMEQVKEIV